MELIAAAPGFKCCDEPLDLRNMAVKKKLASLGITNWEQFHDDTVAPDLRRYFQGFIEAPRCSRTQVRLSDTIDL